MGNQSLNPSLFCRDVLVKLLLTTFLPTHDDAFNPRSNNPEHSKFNQDEETQVEYNADQEEDKTLTLKVIEGCSTKYFLEYVVIFPALMKDLPAASIQRTKKRRT